MDNLGPPRANAAQLAARNIKSVKGRRAGNRATPVRSDSASQFTPMQSQGTQGGGALFGGSIQGAGSFNFTSGGPSFPPPSFSGGNVNNPFGMSNGSSPEPSDNDERRDPGEERASKKRFGDPSTQPGNSLFQSSNPFGQTQPSNPFGATNGQQNGGIFSFGATPSQSQPTINFNSNPAKQPVTNIFSFGSGSSQPSAPSPAISFGGVTQEKQGNNLFSFTQQSAQPLSPTPSSAFNFGAPAPIEKPGSTPFSFGQSPSQPTSTGINYGYTPATDAPVNNIFGASQPPLTNLFGSTTQQPSTPNPFASLNSPTVPTSNIFGSREQSPALSANTNNLFGNREQSPNPSSNGLFSGLNQQSTSTTTGNLFGDSTQAPASPSLLGEQKSKPSSNLFGIPNETPFTSSLFNKPNEQAAPSTNLFGGLQKQTPSTNDSFGNLNKPVDQSVAESKPNSTNAVESSGTPDTQPSSLFSKEPSNTLIGGSKSLFSALPAAQDESSGPKKPPFSFGSTQSPAPEPSKADNIFSPMKSMEAPTSASEPPLSGMFPSLQQPMGPQRTDDGNSTTPTASSTEPTPATIYRIMKGGEPPKEALHNGTNFQDLTIAKKITEEFMYPLVPVKFTDEQRKDFYAAYRMRALNKSMQHYFGGLRITADPTAAIKFYSEQRNAILDDVKLRKASKRKAEEPDWSEETPNKRAKQGEATNATQPPSPTRRSTSPVKQPYLDNASQPYLNGNTTPKLPSFKPPQLTPGAETPVSQSPRGKRKAEDQLTKDGSEQGERPMRQIKTPKLNGSNGGSNTSNIFKNILDSPSRFSPEKSPTKKTASLPATSQNDAPRFNPFGNLPVPASPTNSTNPTSPSGNMFSPIPPAPSPSSLTPVEPVVPKNNTINPPTFITGPVNFMAQFGQQAKKDEKDNEQKLMDRAKEEDMDSDEDEGEWEEKYKEKRRAELEELKDLAKSRTGGFMFGQAQKKTAEESTAGPKPTFGLNPAAQTSSSGVFSPLNVSRTSTPGLVSSAPGSIFDGHTSGKPVSFSGNIFGHLSDSGADSGKSDDADDESGDDTDADADGDSENKDPNYKPEEESGSGFGTPVEETGAGIASAKKSTPFTFGTSKSGGLFGSSNSGTSSPGGSGGLFDRINKDSNGNPIRHVSTEEKENTQPSTANIFGDIKFGSLNKTPGDPSDQTWKPDSPIRFSSATPSNDAKDSPPTVSVTAATPTKAGSPASIFGNPSNSNGPTSAPFSNLFGNSSNAKPAASAGVGFSFGGASNTSSLFPSATTSRATSPGATTDGDSAAEPDADAETHEQIDLTTGGPGEEDEEIVHEVRAKALKFSPNEEADNDNPWETKGVGPLRVLKHKENKMVRILMRADPRGTIVLNKGILPQVNYEASGKTLKLLTAADGGKGLETWILQVKTPEFAHALAEVLQSNKTS